MATQVKFYSIASQAIYSGIATKNPAGIYFVGGPKDGELYKGTVRFGAARVTELQVKPSNAIRGDINVANNIAEIYNGTSWVALGGAGALNSGPFGDMTSAHSKIITGINETNGIISAEVTDFPNLTLTSPESGKVKLGDANAITISGWDLLTSSVTDLESRVESIETVVDGTAKKVTATTGEFGTLTATTGTITNLTATSTAALPSGTTVGGKTIQTIINETIDGLDAYVSTGDVNGFRVTIQETDGKLTSAVLTTPDIVQSIATSGASADKLVSEKAIADKFATLDNAMHFAGIGGSLPSTAKQGDIYLINAGADAGKEYVYDGTKWELIGDNTVFAVNAYSNKIDGTAVTTVPEALDALTTRVNGIVGGTSTASNKGVQVTVANDKNVNPTVTVATTLANTLNFTSASTEKIPSEKAVVDALCWYDGYGNQL